MQHYCVFQCNIIVYVSAKLLCMSVQHCSLTGKVYVNATLLCMSVQHFFMSVQHCCVCQCKTVLYGATLLCMSLQIWNCSPFEYRSLPSFSEKRMTHILLPVIYSMFL